MSRAAATSVSFILCLGYLLVFPLTSWGTATVIAIGGVILIIIDHPGDVMTTSITTVVVLVVAEIIPQNAWTQPILRLVDTLIGIGVVAAVWIGGHLRLSAFGENTFRKEHSREKSRRRLCNDWL